MTTRAALYKKMAHLRKLNMIEQAGVVIVIALLIGISLPIYSNIYTPRAHLTELIMDAHVKRLDVAFDMSLLGEFTDGSGEYTPWRISAGDATLMNAEATVTTLQSGAQALRDKLAGNVVIDPEFDELDQDGTETESTGVDLAGSQNEFNEDRGLSADSFLESGALSEGESKFVVGDNVQIVGGSMLYTTQKLDIVVQSTENGLNPTIGFTLQNVAQPKFASLWYACRPRYGETLSPDFTSDEMRDLIGRCY